MLFPAEGGEISEVLKKDVEFKKIIFLLSKGYK